MSVLASSRSIFSQGILASRGGAASVVPVIAHLPRANYSAVLLPIPRKGQSLTVKVTIAKPKGIKATTPKPVIPKFLAPEKPRRPISAALKTAKVAPVERKVTPPPECWVDASNTHIVILVGTEYKIFPLREGWRSGGRGLVWAKIAALELLAQALFLKGEVGAVTVHSNSATALKAIKGQGVSIPAVTSTIRRLESVMKISPFEFKGVRNIGKKNIAAPFAKGLIPEGYQKMKEPIIIPGALIPFVKTA